MAWAWVAGAASLEEQPEYAYYLFYAPTPKARLETLVRVAGQRWQIEQTFRAASANADWITTKFATGKAGIGTSHWLCWPTRC
jgi:hypothetical protein